MQGSRSKSETSGRDAAVTEDKNTDIIQDGSNEHSEKDPLLN